MEVLSSLDALFARVPIVNEKFFWTFRIADA
jgi:hypothetical protein